MQRSLVQSLETSATMHEVLQQSVVLLQDNRCQEAGGPLAGQEREQLLNSLLLRAAAARTSQAADVKVGRVNV